VRFPRCHTVRILSVIGTWTAMARLIELNSHKALHSSSSTQPGRFPSGDQPDELRPHPFRALTLGEHAPACTVGFDDDGCACLYGYIPQRPARAGRHYIEARWTWRSVIVKADGTGQARAARS